jgi:nucleotide-binding universal stress UspA family protein
MFKTIVVPLDGSAFGEFALPIALSIARRAGATLRLVRVAPTLGDVFFWAPAPATPLANEIREHFRADAMGYLESVGQRLVSAGAGPVAYAVIEGEVAEAIRGNIDSYGGELVVMTSHGRGAPGRIWLGSIADELIRSLKVPVLLARPEEGRAGPDLSREVVLRHILLAVDGTALAERVLSPALALGKLMNADYTLVRIVGTTDHVHLTPPFITEAERIKERRIREANDYLEKLAATLRTDGSHVRTHVVCAEQPATGILEEASTGADLIALETHGRHGLPRLLMGSVADKVVRGASLPVLVSRAY